ncbi:MAG: glycosyltransferase, partial [Planctomycetaceae bacterium]
IPVHATRHDASLRELAGFVVGQIDLSGDRQDVILHDHGQWLPMNRASAATAREYGIKRIVTPRGMLSPWAMRYKRLKKQVAWQWFGRRDLQQASVLHATSQLEADELRALGARQPIAVIPNGVESVSTCVDEMAKCKQVVFMSRLHAKKGVQELVDAWRTVQPRDWELILAGPDEDNFLATLSLLPTESISYVGEVEGQQKWDLLGKASLFVLPSYSENFGVVVAEALMAGTPVITTHGTPWESLCRHRCGWWIPMTSDTLSETLRQATTLELIDLAAMGSRGRIYAAESFSWPSIGEQMASVYRWMIGRGDPPKCVSFK